MTLALKTSASTTLPSRRDEDWRWTDLYGLLRTLPAPSPRIAETLQPGGPFKGLAKAELAIANGRHNWWPGADSKTVEFFEHQSPDNPYAPEELPMAAMAAEQALEPPVSIIQFNGDDVALLRLVTEATETSHHARVGVVVKTGVSATLLESYEGKGGRYLSNTLIEIIVEDGASLERVVIAEDAEEGVGVSTAIVRIAPGAKFAQTVLTSGARRQRIETRVNHPGAQAEARLDGAYLLDAQRHADLTTVVTHAGVEGVTSQLTKGMVTDQARGVFQGRIVVSPGADQTDARMGHHALILSEKAEIDAKPELLIFADDVSCAHGNTIGALDEDALFYAEQRGIPQAEAKAMLTVAFVGEVVDRIEHEGAREIAAAWVARKLGSV
ncbi:Fe-S cluster assembly protein SufD [Caulobacter sp.]|uniref:Fe-S cluster assembly protein SufD n=1 Tax=Caulobacter sp. TaxID=78 RepID=UPI0025C3EB16|nr:Fe-S cluster assembly protein SufD [Caulobacter sp.]